MNQSSKTLRPSKHKGKRGFTLIEVMVVLAITVVIAGVIYTFYNSNNRTLTNAEAKSTLQMEGNQIQKELLNIGTQAKSITVEGDAADADKIIFAVYDGDSTSSSVSNYVFEKESADSGELYKDSNDIHNIYIYKDGTADKGMTKSKHVHEIKVSSLDGATNINDSSNVEVTITLYTKKGLNEVTYPITTNIKLRNKNVTD